MVLTGLVTRFHVLLTVLTLTIYRIIHAYLPGYLCLFTGLNVVLTATYWITCLAYWVNYAYSPDYSCMFTELHVPIYRIDMWSLRLLTGLHEILTGLTVSTYRIIHACLPS